MYNSLLPSIAKRGISLTVGCFCSVSWYGQHSQVYELEWLSHSAATFAHFYTSFGDVQLLLQLIRLLY